MKVITVPKREKFLTDILAQADNEEFIIQTEDGRQFALLSLEEWASFDVGDSDDFKEEVEATSENRELAEFVAARRKEGKRVSITDVKKQLGLN